MEAIRNAAAILLGVSAMAAGCSQEPNSSDTGSRASVKGFYEALLRQDWPAAYALLHADSKAKCNEEQFARLAAQYRRSIGFEPDAVHVRSCEEHTTEAVAHVVLTPAGESGQRYFKEATTLRQGRDGWGVVLSANFGQRASR
jgi:hypothetical protein